MSKPTFVTAYPLELYIRAYGNSAVPVGTLIYGNQLGENTIGWLKMDSETMHAIKDYWDLVLVLIPIQQAGQRVLEIYDDKHFVLRDFSHKTYDVPGDA